MIAAGSARTALEDYNNNKVFSYSLQWNLYSFSPNSDSGCCYCPRKVILRFVSFKNTMHMTCYVQNTIQGVVFKSCIDREKTNKTLNWPAICDFYFWSANNKPPQRGCISGPDKSRRILSFLSFSFIAPFSKICRATPLAHVSLPCPFGL